ncbi:MAG TPA: chromosome segregation protein SMC [Candidatus Krumholzibacteria bacterium]|nr:chromosome segregation protein SMC [Candidatus Krumholzibacteria bacterium]
MQLRKIEISGFKSFMSGLELDFSGGVTAIIGPNGCGKSNVVDSIRWVLGEQRTRMLRNTKMENVLFNGTRLRKPLGMAEVFMTINNEDGSLNLDYKEVRIGRRLYRSGVSEYLVNGQPVRLKDVRGLLVDTGLGNSAYAIIERDMIEKVLSEKEDEKRHLLEEAAGVMRYRLQREEAERKIKATEQDLTRLVDILNELDKELRSLKYQMGKARRYQSLKEQADAMEIALLKSSLFGILVRRDELHAERDAQENVRLVGDNEISIRENRLQELRVESAEFEKRMQDLNETRYTAMTSLQQHDERIAVHTERMNASRGRIQEDDLEITRARERMQQAETELEESRGLAVSRRRELEESRELLGARTTALREANQHLEEVRGALRRRKQIALDLVREQAKEKGVLEQIEVTLTDLARRQDAIELQLDELSSEEAKRVEELSEIEARVAAQQAVLSEKQNALTALTATIDEASAAISAGDGDLADANRALAKLAEKREFMLRVHEEHTRTAEELRQHGAVAGVLSDLVRVEKRYRKCFEACLSPILRSVVTGSRRDAMDWLRSYRRGDAGRVQILFPDHFVSREELPSGEGIIGPARELVDCNPAVSTYLIAYLEGVVVVEDVDAALRLIEQGRASRVATLDGVFFDGPGRVLVAGQDDIDVTLLEMQAKLAELDRSLAEAEAHEAELRRRRDALTEERERAQREIAAIRGVLAEEERKHEGLVRSRRDAELHLVRVKEKITALEQGISETRDAMLQLRPKLDAARRTAEMPDAGAELDGADLAALEEQVHSAEREREAVADEVGGLRVADVSAAAELEALETRVRNHEKLLEELGGLVRAREEDRARAEEQIRLSSEDIATTREAVTRLHSEKVAIETRIEGESEAYAQLKETRDALETEIKGMKDQRETKRANLERVNVELASVDTRMAGLIEKAREKFGQDLEPMIADRSRFDASEWEKVSREEMDEIKQRLEQFGPVNMLAMAEHDEKKERFDFLAKQRQDLEEAKDSLQQAIRRINKEARRLLGETFDRVRENFKQTFMTLFDGGEADLMFVDSEDPLEANIKIVASPRGKKLHDISSLSSGERALVALSLLFAIYLVKPSPFCVFDEVDAPLDDANIGRFVKLLRSFTDHTQFIVITHNKKTMEAADNLYGVTMEEPGVSKLISVHLDDAERFKARGVVSIPADSASSA